MIFLPDVDYTPILVSTFPGQDQTMVSEKVAEVHARSKADDHKEGTMSELVAEVMVLDASTEEAGPAGESAGGTLGQRVELLERTMSVLQMQVGLLQIQVQGLKRPEVEKPKKKPRAKPHYTAEQKAEIRDRQAVLTG
jgi:hypothetical protein